MSLPEEYYRDNELEDAKKLAPEWKNPPSVKKLKDDINEASSAHGTHVAKVNKWLEGLRGQIRIRTQEGRSQVQPKLIRRQNEWRYASLEEPFLSTNTMFRVNPVTQEDVDAARQNELILNKQFRTDIPKVPFINKYIRTAVNTGSVVMKLAWEEQYGTVREEYMVPDFAESPEEFMQAAQVLIQAGELDEPTMQEMLQTGEWMEVPIGQHPEVQLVDKKYINRPVVEIKDSRAIIIDPSCQGDINKAQFIVDKFVTDLSSLKKDGRYDLDQLEKIGQRDYDPRTTDDYNYELEETKTFAFKDKPRKKLVVYEYWGFWDIHDDGIVVPIVATWVGNILIRLAENPYPDKKLPFVVVQYLPPDTDSVYGDPDASLLEDSQAIMGAVMRSIIDIIGRTASAQQGIRKDLLDANQLKNFKEMRDFEFNTIQGGIENALYMAKMPELPRSAMEVIALVNSEAESLSGVRGFQEGIGSQSLGNMLDLDTDIPLFDGTFKKLRDLLEGDILIGLDGKGTKVEKLFEIAYPETAYELIFSNGTKVVCGGEHRWKVAHSHSAGYKVWETDDIAKAFNKGKPIYIPRIQRIDMEGTYPEVDPYCLGYWLGDGNSYKSAITTADKEVIDRFERHYRLVLDKSCIGKTGKAKTYDVWMKEDRCRQDSVTGKFISDPDSFEYYLRTLGLFKKFDGHKHIPEPYFSAPYEVKLELLRGLMDSDGYTHSGGFNVFTQSEGQLKDDFIRLLKSMGIKCSISKHLTADEINNRRKHYHNKGLDITSKLGIYEIGFTCQDNPFHIERKAKKYRTPKHSNTYKLVAVNVVDKVLMRCLQVDSPDHLFAITKDYVLTHNTATGIRSAMDATAIREAGILRRLSEGLKEVGKKIIAMNSIWLDDEEIIRITDDEFVAIKRDDLAGSFDLDMEISTAASDNQKAEELAFMLQTLGAAVPFDIIKIIMVKIARLRKLPDLAYALEQYQPQPDPMQQALMQAQIDNLKAETQKGITTADKNKADEVLKLAKADEAGAKSRHTHSESDMLDLDYLQEATGVNQDRELEQIILKEKAKPKPKTSSK